MAVSRMVREVCANPVVAGSHFDIQKQLREHSLQQQRMRQLTETLNQIPARYYPADLLQYQTACEAQSKVVSALQRYADQFAHWRKQGTSLIFSGTCGTGKTYLSWCLFRLLVEREYTVCQVSLSQLVDRLTCTPGGSLHQRMQPFLQTDLLVIDELDLNAAPSAWQRTERRSLLFEVVDARYNAANKPLLLITNVEMPALRQQISDKTLDRVLDRGCILHFNWQSFRSALSHPGSESKWQHNP